jgi:DNA repair exonuclease SbcCD nuclease subunit
MFEFLYATDPHIKHSQPNNRIDNYNESILKKLDFIGRYAKDNGVKVLVLGGDLTDSHHVKSEPLIAFSDIIFKYDLKLYYVFGNHDVQGANFNYIDKTCLGFITRYRWFHDLNEKVYREDRCFISGYNYTTEKKRNDFMFPEIKDKIRTPYKKILVLHANIYDIHNKNPMIDKIGITYDQIKTDADLILCGHTHYGWEDAGYIGKTMVINPGSIARVKYDEDINGFGPRLVHFRIGQDIDYKFVKIPKVKAFNTTKVIKHKATKQRTNNFIQKFKGLSVSDSDVIKSFRELLENVPTELQPYMNEEVKNNCYDYLHRIQND